MEQEDTKTTSLIKSMTSMSPIFLPGSSKESLETSPTFVGISILPNSPLLTQEGNWQLVSFLASLPNPSLIFLVDSLNRHNVKAMAKLKKGNKMPSDEDALKVALKAGAEYHKFFSESITHLESCQPDNVGKVTLVRWDDIEDDVMKNQQQVIQNHYESSQIFKDRIGKFHVKCLALIKEYFVQILISSRQNCPRLFKLSKTSIEKPLNAYPAHGLLSS